MAPAKQTEEPQWPPRSPHEALLGTPRGRERYRLLANRTSPTRSPLKNSRPASSFSARHENDMAGLEVGAGDDDDDEDEDDEETLQLKLQEIQARLKLKKLQNARPQKQRDASQPEKGPRPKSTPPAEREPRQDAAAHARPTSQGAVEIPASPVRRPRPEPTNTSPSRVLMGIDKGLKANDISLKRAPSLRKNEEPQGGQKQYQFGGHLKRSRTPSANAGPQQASETVRPPTFNERLAAARTDESDRLERRERAQKARTEAFSIGQKEIEDYKSKAVDLPEKPEAPAPQFSREEILGTGSSSTVSNRRTQAPDSPAQAKPTDETAPEDVPEAEAAAFEPYSSFHLSKRIVPHPILTRHFAGKKILNIKDLLREVKAPDFELPDYEQDIIVFAIVAKRSEPRSHQPRQDKNGVQQPERGKYMVITLVDLQHEMELFLFNSGFTRFWKISEGTVIALLNPIIMAPPRGREATGRFSLVVNSDCDTIVEVGTARDLGFCKSVRKDGSTCNSWVHRKRTEFCEYHTNEAINRKRTGRVELSGADFGRRKTNSRETTRVESETQKRSGKYDRETQSHWFMAKSLSSADLIDGASKLADNREREEGLKRRLAAQERERGIIQRLGKVGSGAGREYMKRADGQRPAGAAATSSPTPDSTGSGTDAPRLSANALGLLAPPDKGHKIHLGPVKRKRPESAQSGSTMSSSSYAAAGQPGSASSGKNGGTGGLGWGGNLKDKLSRMKDGEKLRPGLAEAAPSSDGAGHPPVRKKTRFVTDKGIREAGRESLGDALPAKKEMLHNDDYDDDDLVILK